jgi:hypothetical protein
MNYAGACMKMPRMMHALTLLFLIITLTASVYAAANGTSSIALSENNITVTQDGRATFGYTINLMNGSAGNTSIFTPNTRDLYLKNMTVSFTKPSGIPPFSGTAMIYFDWTPAGTYNAIFTAIGADPSAEEATLNIRVITSTSTTIIPSTSYSTTIPNSPASALSQSNIMLYIITAIIIVLIIAGVAYILIKSGVLS